MLTLNNKNKLLDLLAQGATAITPNNRLSAALIQDYFNYCAGQTIDKPACYPFTTVLNKRYNQLIFQSPHQHHPILLNEAQCQHLWQKIIKSNDDITYSTGLLNAVTEAWTHCQQWHIDPDDSIFHYTPQTRQFQHWWNVFNQKIQQITAISQHQIIPYFITNNRPLFTQAIIWVCFDDFNPQQLSLQKHLEEHGVTQYFYDLPEQTMSTKVFAAKDTNEEYQQLIAWLHLKIQQDEQRIGVVVPDLEQKSRALRRTLLNHFDQSLFNISLGQALNKFPIIDHALTWLNLDLKQLNSHQAALLLQSPYIGGAKKEFINRSHYLQDSLLLQNQSFSLKAFISDLVSFAPLLAEYLEKITQYPKQASPEEWIKLFQERLNHLGYPGDDGLSSENYQCFNRFSMLFDEFRQLSLISNMLSQKEALDALTQLMNNTIFQSQKTNAPIQISGLLEASGCEFDSLWVMGLTDQCLPQKTRLSAFIPPQLQRERHMPHSLPERELLFARQTIQRLTKGSINTVFSYPRLQGESPNLPCSLITHYPAFAEIKMPDTAEEASFLISSDELYQVPLKQDERISGGTSILANQAKCPFKAFAEHRLKAKPMHLTSDGLDNKEKGILIHKVMELLWSKLESQKKLLGLNAHDLNQYVDEAIQTALIPLQQNHPDLFNSLIQEVEHTRLKRLIYSCLDWEKQRPPFTISTLEQSYSIHLAGLDFTVRVDRLDQVEDNKWVIDYKSSLPVSKPWNEERPKEPQLLLYALLDEHINTLLLMQLKTGKILCSGISELKQDIKGITALKEEEHWEDHRENWKQQLTHLAQEIQQGICSPQPASNAICQSCDFQSLCRYQAG